jgi:hypothetical protein
MPDRLNFFEPFERLAPHHENQLTRALLVLLRLSPLVHTAWLKLIAPARELHRLGPATFNTQRAAVQEAGGGEEAAELISVYLAPERPLSGGGVIVESDRAQVLDAVIDYGGELIVVVENKIGEADDLQARHLNFTGAKVRLADGQAAVVVLWRDLIEAIVALRERDLFGGAEAAVVSDFLSYVEDNFTELGPFRTLALARGSEYRVRRRLRAVLGEAAGDEARESAYAPYIPTPAGAVAGKNAYLRQHPDKPQTIELALYPADTLTQARVFYARTDAVKGLRQLAAEPGWAAGPNFHFGYMQTGYAWTATDLDLGAYLDLWTRWIDEEHSRDRSEWDDYWSWLEAHGLAAAADRAEFDRHFTHTRRPDACPRPGLWLSRSWSLDEAAELDARGRFALQVRESLNEALTTLGEPPLNAGSRRVLGGVSAGPAPA